MLDKPKYLQPETAGRERWLISYTDIVTILLILFVTIAAQSMKARVIPQAPPPPPPPQNHREQLLGVQEKLRRQNLDLRIEPRGLIISLPQAILFASGEDSVSPSALPVISQIADVLRNIDNKVALVGHADAVPIHTQRFRSNWELSAARSLNLLALLTTQYEIPESRLSLQSYGANNPKGPNDTADGRAENRRVEILILDNGTAQ